MGVLEYNELRKMNNKPLSNNNALITFDKALDLAALDGESTYLMRECWSCVRDDAGILHATYRAGNGHAYGTEGKIFYTWSTNNGDTWNPVVEICDDSDGNPGDPVISCPHDLHNIVYLTFCKKSATAAGTYFMYSDSSNANGSRVWSVPYQIPTPNFIDGDAYCSQKILTINGKIYTAFYQSPNLNRIAIFQAPNSKPAAGDWVELHVFSGLGDDLSEPFIWLAPDITYGIIMKMIIRRENNRAIYLESKSTGYTVWTNPIDVNIESAKVMGRHYIHQFAPEQLMMMFRGVGRYFYIAFSRDGIVWGKPMCILGESMGYGDFLALPDRMYMWVSVDNREESPEIARIIQYFINPQLISSQIPARKSQPLIKKSITIPKAGSLDIALDLDGVEKISILMTTATAVNTTDLSMDYIPGYEDSYASSVWINVPVTNSISSATARWYTPSFSVLEARGTLRIKNANVDTDVTGTFIVQGI